ncbi:MAG: type II secretion system protein [Acidimicrobiia bacterium]
MRGTDYGGNNVLKHIQARTDWEDKGALERGFTLIELLVVIAILGILAVVGVLAFGGLTDSARKSTAKTERTQVQAAVDAYNAKNGTWPALNGGAGNISALTTDGELKASQLDKLQCEYSLDANHDVQFTGKNGSTFAADANCA